MKIIRLSVIALLVLTALFFAFSSYKKIRVKEAATLNAKRLPGFQFTDLHGKAYTRADVSSSTVQTIINYFNPGCEHCQYMAQSMAQHADSFSTTQVIMVAYSDSAEIAGFGKKYRLNKLRHLVLLRDGNHDFFRFFGTATIPSFFIYDQNSRLVKKYSGETRVENLFP